MAYISWLGGKSVAPLFVRASFRRGPQDRVMLQNAFMEGSLAGGGLRSRLQVVSSHHNMSQPGGTEKIFFYVADLILWNLLHCEAGGGEAAFPPPSMAALIEEAGTSVPSVEDLSCCPTYRKPY